MLSRGLISGHAGATGKGDFRAFSPRFQGENVERNLALVEALEGRRRQGRDGRADRHRLGAAQGTDIVPLIGARRRDRLNEAMGGLAVVLTPDDLAAIEQVVPKNAAAGDRYPTAQIALLDSEKAPRP